MPLPRPSRRARSSLVCLLVLLGLVGAGCGSVTTEAAATVEGTEITEASLDEELEAITSDEAYQSRLEQQLQAPVRGEGQGTFDSGFVARVLTLRVYYELLERELDRRGIELTAEDLDAERDAAIQSVGGQEVFDQLPRAYQERLVRQRALLTAIEEAFAGEGVEEGDAEAYFEENRQDFEERCVAHILVGTADSPRPTTDRSREEAAARARELYDQLQAGADFTELASSDANDDTVAAAEGGSLDCITRQTGFDPTFLEAAFAAEVGEVTEPVETQFGYHLILVSSAETPTFEEVEAEVQQRLAQENAGLLDEFLLTTTCEADVEVSSRYGTWDTSACDRGGVAAVSPPPGPSTTGPPAIGAGGTDPAAPGSGAGG